MRVEGIREKNLLHAFAVSAEYKVYNFMDLLSQILQEESHIESAQEKEVVPSSPMNHGFAPSYYLLVPPSFSKGFYHRNVDISQQSPEWNINQVYDYQSFDKDKHQELPSRLDDQSVDDNDNVDVSTFREIAESSLVFTQIGVEHTQFVDDQHGKDVLPLGGAVGPILKLVVDKVVYDKSLDVGHSQPVGDNNVSGVVLFKGIAEIGLSSNDRPLSVEKGRVGGYYLTNQDAEKNHLGELVKKSDAKISNDRVDVSLLTFEQKIPENTTRYIKLESPSNAYSEKVLQTLKDVDLSFYMDNNTDDNVGEEPPNISVNLQQNVMHEDTKDVQQVQQVNREFQKIEHKYVRVPLDDTEVSIRVVRDSIKVTLEVKTDIAQNLGREVNKLVESLNNIGFRLEALQVNGSLVYSESKYDDRREERNKYFQHYKHKQYSKGDRFDLSI